MFIFVYIYYYGSYTYLINYRKGDLKRQLHSMDLTLIIKTVKVEAIKKPTSERSRSTFYWKIIASKFSI